MTSISDNNLTAITESPRRFYLGDWSGGTLSALVGLPLTLACGGMLFSGLGPELTQQGITSALYAAVIACLVSAFIGCHQLQISGPRVASTLLLADFLQMIYPQLLQVVGERDITATMLAFMIACVILSGLFQLLFALLRLGQFIKFLPITVTQGVSTAIGLIIISKQLPDLANSATPASWSALFSDPLSLLSTPGYGWLWLVTGAVIALLFLKSILKWRGITGGKLLDLLPLAAPIVGVALFFALAPSSEPGLFLETMQIGWPPVLSYWHAVAEAWPLLVAQGDQVILTALAIAGMGALNSLMSNRTLENALPCQYRATSRELLGQGLGNLLSGVLGGMPSAGSEARGMSNHGGGGLTRVSGVVHALVVLVIVGVGSGLLAFIPKVVLAALLVHTGLVMAKPMAVLALRVGTTCRERTWRETWECVKDIVLSFLVVGAMLVTAQFYDVASAIAAGFAASACLFILEMSTSTCYRVLVGDRYRSRRVRHADEARYLRAQGAQIKVLELEGAIFFGTAEQLRNAVSDLMAATPATPATTTRWLILDFRKVTEVDITGAEIIAACRKEHKKNLTIYLAHIRKGDDSYRALCSAGLIGVDGVDWFKSTDGALEQAENQLLASDRDATAVTDRPLELAEFPLTEGLSSEHLLPLRAVLRTRVFAKGGHLFEQGGMADEIFLLRSGSVSIHAEEAVIDDGKQANGNTRLRRVTFSPGVFIGETAFIERREHSLAACADEPVEVYVLSRTSLEQLAIEHPALGQHLMLELCRHLAWRLRTVTEEVRMLERWD